MKLVDLRRFHVISKDLAGTCLLSILKKVDQHSVTEFSLQGHSRKHRAITDFKNKYSKKSYDSWLTQCRTKAS